MTTSAFFLLASLLIVLMVLAKPLGGFIACLVENRLPGPVITVESYLWKLAGVSNSEMSWLHYLLALLSLTLAGTGLLTAILMLQTYLPLNPQHFPGLPLDLALNTAISFATNTNWQAYAGESTLSYFSQMAGLTVQNFLSAAIGIAVAFALMRAFSRQGVGTLGNAWQDITRITVYLLIPLSLIFALFLIWQGVIQNLDPYRQFTSLEGIRQWMPMGPVASQEAIKLLGTNGGGFFNASSAHPFENPTALTNFVQMLSMLLIPAALCFTFGKVVGDLRQGQTLLQAMTVIFVLCAVVVIRAEGSGNPELFSHGAALATNMEGKESRFGILSSSLFAVITTATSSGAVNAMLDSFTALGGMIPLWLIQTGEVIFGGAGSGLYGMLLFVLLAVFVAGLMIGRTPEYLGKKIESSEMKMIVLALLVSPLVALSGTALVLLTGEGQAAILNPGPHGFSEILYAFSSVANNNGSAFSGLNATTPFWNTLLGGCMFIGRFATLAPVMAIAGSLVCKKRQATGPGTLASHGPLFTGLLIGTLLLMAALTFIPALALGPVAEHLSLH